MRRRWPLVLGLLIAVALLVWQGLERRSGDGPRTADLADRTRGVGPEPTLVGTAPELPPRPAPEPAGQDGEASTPTKPKVETLKLTSPKGWIAHPEIGCRLVLSSGPAWYSYDESLWQRGGASLRDRYPSEDWPSLDGVVCLATIVGHLTTGAHGTNIEAVLCIDGSEVLDIRPGNTSANIIGFTGGPPAMRWHIPIKADILAIFAKARWAEVRFRRRRLTREEELTDRRPIQVNGKRLTVREYIALQRPPESVEFSSAALETLKRLAREHAQR